MSEFVPNHSASEEVKGPLVSTGMGRGMHTNVAIVLVVAGALWGFFVRAITAPTLALLLLAGAIGLLGEVPRLLATGEVRARIKDRLKPNRFLVIRRDRSPARFYFYVIAYAALGSFSFVAACIILTPLVAGYAK